VEVNPLSTSASPSTPAPATTEAAGRFNCSSGVRLWRDGWSDEKKEWCCKTTKVGCSSNATSPHGKTYDCNSAGFGGWDALWPQEQRDYCCKAKGIGCAQAETSTFASTTAKPASASHQYDCQTDYYSWFSSWSQAKQEWCCERTGRGCVQDEYECFGPRIDEELHQDWVHSWPEPHRQWCCTWKRVGCEQGAAVRVQAKFAGSRGVASASDGPLPFVLTVAGAVAVVLTVVAAQRSCRKAHAAVGGRVLARRSAAADDCESAWLNEAGVGLTVSADDY